MKEIKETDMTMQQEPIQENKMGVRKFDTSVLKKSL